MRVALTGASGFIGSAIAHALHRDGHQIQALVRSASRTDHLKGIVDRFIVGTCEDTSAWPEFLDSTDLVVHNAVDWEPLKSADRERHYKTNLLGTLNLIDASSPRRFLFISTIAVHHDISSRWNSVIDEDHPLRPASAYGAYKASVEAHLWAAHVEREMPFCCLRPCGVYGIDPCLERSHGYDLLKATWNGKQCRRRGGGKFVHVEDVADAVAGVVLHELHWNATVNLVDCYARWSDWAVLAAEVLGRDAAIVHQDPTCSINTFDCTLARSLGPAFDRGHNGIRAFLHELREAMEQNGVFTQRRHSPDGE